MPTSDWYQQALTPPEALECNIRIGVIPSTDHCQALVELKDPLTGVLVGQWSRPHQPGRQLSALIEWAGRQALAAIDAHTEPF